MHLCTFPLIDNTKYLNIGLSILFLCIGMGIVKALTTFNAFIDAQYEQHSTDYKYIVIYFKVHLKTLTAADSSKVLNAGPLLVYFSTAFCTFCQEAKYFVYNNRRVWCGRFCIRGLPMSISHISEIPNVGKKKTKIQTNQKKKKTGEVQNLTKAALPFVWQTVCADFFYQTTWFMIYMFRDRDRTPSLTAHYNWGLCFTGHKMPVISESAVSFHSSLRFWSSGASVHWGTWWRQLNVSKVSEPGPGHWDWAAGLLRIHGLSRILISIIVTQFHPQTHTLAHSHLQLWHWGNRGEGSQNRDGGVLELCFSGEAQFLE